MRTRLVILFCFSIATIAFAQTNAGGNLTAQAIDRKLREAYAALTSYSDTGTSIVTRPGQTNVTTFSLRMQRTNLFILQWVQTRAGETNQGHWWQAGPDAPGRFPGGLVTNILGQATNDSPLYGADLFDVRMRSGEAPSIMKLFFQSGPLHLDIFGFDAADPTNSSPDERVVTDGKVGDVDCYVLTRTTPELKHPPFPFPQGKRVVRTWIGKQDYLVHRFDYVSEAPGAETLTLIRENIVVNRKYTDEDFQVEMPEVEHTSSITLTSPPAQTNSDSGQTNGTGPRHKRGKWRRN